MCFFIEIIKINHKNIKHIIVYEIYVIDKVIKSTCTLMVVVLKERNGFMHMF